MAKKKASKSVKNEITEFMDKLTETASAPQEMPKGFKLVSSGAGYHDFSKNPVFQGHFVSKFLAPKDIPANKTKKGDVIGFNFLEEGTGREAIISNSYAINKALEEDGFKTDTLWWIEFIEKAMVKGKPLNRFQIGKQ